MMFDPKANFDGGELPHPKNLIQPWHIPIVVKVIAEIFPKLEGYPAYGIRVAIIPDTQSSVQTWVRMLVDKEKSLELYEINGQILFDTKQSKNIKMFYILKAR